MNAVEDTIRQLISTQTENREETYEKKKQKNDETTMTKNV